MSEKLYIPAQQLLEDSFRLAAILDQVIHAVDADFVRAAIDTAIR